MLTPMDIHNHEFKKSFRGYNENEVDEFLDRIVIDYEKALRESEKLRERSHLNEKELSHYKNLEKNLQDTLMIAQGAAEEVMNAARKSAKDIRDSANNDAQRIRENTLREAQNIRMQANLDAKRCIDDAANKLHAVAVEYDRLVREKNGFLLKIRTALESELAVVSQLLNTIPDANEIDSIKSAALKIEQRLKTLDIQTDAASDALFPAPKFDSVSTPEIAEEDKVSESIEIDQSEETPIEEIQSNP